MQAPPQHGDGAEDAPPGPAAPRLSVVLVTLNEEANITDAVRSLLDQEDTDLEVLVVDGGSKDRTVELAQDLAAQDPRVRVHASDRHLPIGESRNLGLRMARAPRLAFMSADATAGPGWARAAMEGLETVDVVYGRQEHDPGHLTVGAAVRGMRYHHFRDDGRRPPADFASNVNAAIRRDVFDKVRYVDDGPASALDDILFTAEAEQLGFMVAYRRDMLVRHKDAASLRQELVKNRREGHGWGLLSPRLGVHRTVLLWGLGLLGMALAAAVLRHPAVVTLALLALFAPALRRAVRGGGPLLRKRPLALLGAVLVSPLFDLAFLVAYVNGLRHRRSDLTGVIQAQGA